MPAITTRPLQRLTFAIAIGAALLLLCTGCISYTVGMGAETTPVGETSSSTSLNIVPGTLKESSQSTPTRRPSVDTEVRYGLSPRTDIGFRLATYSGVIATWKHQLTRPDSSRMIENRPRTSIMLGGGLINGAEHAAWEVTLISSGAWSTAGQLYGAVRATQAVAVTGTARKDDPVVGTVIGYLLGTRESSFGPELGVYYDRSALGINTRRILVIPSIVVRSEGINLFGWRR